MFIDKIITSLLKYGQITEAEIAVDQLHRTIVE